MILVHWAAILALLATFYSAPAFCASDSGNQETKTEQNRQQFAGDGGQNAGGEQMQQQGQDAGEQKMLGQPKVVEPKKKRERNSDGVLSRQRKGQHGPDNDPPHLREQEKFRALSKKQSIPKKIRDYLRTIYGWERDYITVAKPFETVNLVANEVADINGHYQYRKIEWKKSGQIRRVKEMGSSIDTMESLYAPPDIWVKNQGSGWRKKCSDCYFGPPGIKSEAELMPEVKIIETWMAYPIKIERKPWGTILRFRRFQNKGSMEWEIDDTTQTVTHVRVRNSLGEVEWREERTYNFENSIPILKGINMEYPGKFTREIEYIWKIGDSVVNPNEMRIPAD